MNNTKEVFSNYQISKVEYLDEGACGKIMKCELMNNPWNDSKQLAIKIIDKNKVKCNWRKEVEIHSKMKYDNVVQLYEWKEHDEYVYIVLEYCSLGNLADYFNKQLPSMNLDDRISLTSKLFVQMFDIYTNLYKLKIAHRDLKPANFVISNISPFTIKLIDFGFSKIDDLMQSFAGTPLYMAPEISSKIIKDSNKSYNYKCDIWSMGIILYQSFHNEIPTKSLSFPELDAKQKTIKTNSCDSDISTLITGMLTYNETQRFDYDTLSILYTIFKFLKN